MMWVLDRDDWKRHRGGIVRTLLVSVFGLGIGVVTLLTLAGCGNTSAADAATGARQAMTGEGRDVQPVAAQPIRYHVINASSGPIYKVFMDTPYWNYSWGTVDQGEAEMVRGKETEMLGEVELGWKDPKGNWHYAKANIQSVGGKGYVGPITFTIRDQGSMVARRGRP